jgi:hypothetical protein
VGPVISIGKLKTGRVEIFRTSASKTSNAEVVAEISGAVASAMGDLAVAIDLGVAAVALAEAALEDLAAEAASAVGVAGLEDGGNNLGLGFACRF